MPGAASQPNQTLTRICDDHDASPAQIAIAWLLRRSPAMLPIPGTSNLEHLQHNSAAASIELSDDEMAAITGDVDAESAEESTWTRRRPFLAQGITELSRPAQVGSMFLASPRA